MRPTADHYRLLDLQPGASDDEVRRAYRELVRVWHPDRFGQDPTLRERAEEKLKRINEAYRIISSSPETPSDPDDDPAVEAWRVRNRRGERRAPHLRAILTWIARGDVSPSDRIFDPARREWLRADAIPEARAMFRRMAARRHRAWAAFLIVAALMVLIRRPSSAGAVIAAVLLSLAIILWLASSRW
ncbi:MAG TPA: J domain-containing protein [Thermoanaerobaculia bacterium]|nr:J domain-containing protein [Thermoanaerobaculia bacterium]